VLKKIKEINKKELQGVNILRLLMRGARYPRVLLI
jgi:hypothetical protein